MITCVDRGGTFTDVVEIEPDGRCRIRKVRSDRAVVGELARGALRFGTTVATNALLERRIAPTLLVVTRGFADLPWIGDMTRPSLFRPEETRPPPLCTRVLEVDGRWGPDGVEFEPLVLPDAVDLDGIEAAAVVLLHGPRRPEHERAVADRLRALGLRGPVALGHEVCPELGYLARIETTLVQASVEPVLRAALVADRIPVEALAVRSDGSLVPVARLGAADAVLSGPAGGVLAIAEIARRLGKVVVGLDMGGTSTDVCVVDPAAPIPRQEGVVEVAGVRVRRDQLEVLTIAAGGGSVCWTDGRQLRVGPMSAGASPGPQCFGGGGPPTLTDAALALGLVDAAAFDPPLRPELVSLPGDAAELVDVAREAMAHAVRRLLARRGIDPAECVLCPYGGAAGQHAASVAERLGAERVVVHPAASALSAWGQQLARREESRSRALWRPLAEAWPEVERAWTELLAELPDWPEVERTVVVRHAGTDHGIEVTAGDPAEAARAFRELHRHRFGFDRELGLEIVDARVRVGERAGASAADGPPLVDREVRGPTRVDAPTTSIVVPAGWVARPLDGLLELVRVEGVPRRPDSSARSEHAVALWASRFEAVAAEAGEALRRLARSVNIRERLDFSCAVFDTDGRLIANAPHVPVHLGAMGATVRDLLARHPEPEEGQHWLCNDPAAGGSHLPDLTVTTVVRWGGRRMFVACRAHHVDVGGSTPGSMPPRSETLADEGFVVRHLPLVVGGAIRADLATHLVGCRQPDTVRADLEAQVASNTLATRLLRGLGPAEVVAAQASHLLAVAEEAVRELLPSLPEEATARDTIDGVPLSLTLRRRGERLVVDLTGTGGPHPGNLNAPPAVVRAAVLYGLRVLADRPLPLNEGALAPVDWIVPSPSIVDPPAAAAVAGGNVETSQRLVDLLLAAAGRMAPSAGSMSNLTIGGRGWSSYETVGGGQGASPTQDGPSGRQLHMTNTRATDPEVLEARMPLRVRRFELRRGSGGAGRWSGGDGLVREIEVLAPARVALLATRRTRGAPGLTGGGEGAPGADAVIVGGVTIPWDGQPLDLSAGDRVVVRTPGGGGWGPPLLRCASEAP
ncbi:MAG: hydantoinase B/oxoprolinase family protein [Alphaproteobacteria bacterium]|nr:hydantoinase B/oxoprolinase family protein [Alphaproteobacteria bacterium]MCB9696312.1 hydantoinase B/oxoprolinase family protein [Alphaproteobacteria bacterium]